MQVVAERLLDDDARPVVALFLGQPCLAKLFDDSRKKSRSDGEVEKSAAVRVVLLIDFRDLLPQPLVRIRVLKISFDVVDALGEPGPDRRVDRRGRIFGNFFRERLAESFRVEVVAGETDDGELFGEQIIGGEIAQRGDELALVRSPVAPKMTMTQGAATVFVWAWFMRIL